MEFELQLFKTLENPREIKKASKNPHRIVKWLDLESFSGPNPSFWSASFDLDVLKNSSTKYFKIDFHFSSVLKNCKWIQLDKLNLHSYKLSIKEQAWVKNHNLILRPLSLSRRYIIWKVTKYRKAFSIFCLVFKKISKINFSYYIEKITDSWFFWRRDQIENTFWDLVAFTYLDCSMLFVMFTEGASHRGIAYLMKKNTHEFVLFVLLSLEGGNKENNFIESIAFYSSPHM